MAGGKVAARGIEMQVLSADHPLESDCTVVRGSPIHGWGLCAKEKISKGTYFLEYLGEKITKKESARRSLVLAEKARQTGGASVYIFNLNQKQDLDGDRPDNLARLINHSCNPNCEAVQSRGRIWMVALKTIREGTELTFNYGFELAQWKDNPCRCGAKNCVGAIVARRYWRRLRKLMKRAENP